MYVSNLVLTGIELSPVDELKNIITDMDVSQGDVRQGSLVRLEFYRQTQTGILELGTTALTVQR